MHGFSQHCRILIRKLPSAARFENLACYDLSCMLCSPYRPAVVFLSSIKVIQGMNLQIF